jgi:hypothetical protein
MGSPIMLSARKVFSGLSKPTLKKIIEAREEGFAYMDIEAQKFYRKFDELPSIKYVDLEDVYECLLEKVLFK